MSRVVINNTRGTRGEEKPVRVLLPLRVSFPRRPVEERVIDHVKNLDKDRMRPRLLAFDSSKLCGPLS